jgi:hypothetical protein
MGTEETIDFVVIGVVAIVVGYIVYEISQAASSVQQSTGGWFGTIAGAGAGALAVLLLL